MEFTLFMMFSMLEAFALYYFMFRLFKIDLHIPSIIFASLINSYTSYTLRISFDLALVDIPVQILLLICLLWLLFQVPIFYSILIACISYVSYVVVQLPIVFLLTLNQRIQPTLEDTTGLLIYSIQTLTSIIVFIIGWSIHKLGKGFSFVPHSSFIPIKPKKRQVLSLILYILTFCSVPIVYFLVKYSTVFTIMPFVLGALLFLCLYSAYRSDRRYD